MQEKRPFWLDMNGGDTIRFLDQVYRVKASGAQTGGLFGLVEVSTPQGSGPLPHVHEREDEAFYVLEGSYGVTVGNDRFDAGRDGSSSPLGGFFTATWSGQRRPDTLGSSSRADGETFYRDVVRATGGAASRCSARRLLRECRRHDRTNPGMTHDSSRACGSRRWSCARRARAGQGRNSSRSRSPSMSVGDSSV